MNNNKIYCVTGYFSPHTTKGLNHQKVLYVGVSRETAMNISNFPIHGLSAIEISVWADDVHIETWVDTHYDELEKIGSGELK